MDAARAVPRPPVRSREVRRRRWAAAQRLQAVWRQTLLRRRAAEGRLLRAELAAAEESVAAAQRTAQVATAAAVAACRLLAEARAEFSGDARAGEKALAAEAVARSTALAEVAALEVRVERLAAEQKETLEEAELLLAETWAELAAERARNAQAEAEAAAEAAEARLAADCAAAEKAVLLREMEEAEEWWTAHERAARAKAEAGVMVPTVPTAMTAASPVTAAVTRTGGRQRKAARSARQTATARLEASLGADWQYTIDGRLEVARAHWMLKQ